MKIDLSKMSREELQKLKKDVDKALKSVETRRRSDAIKAAEKAAKEFGFSLKDLAGAAKPRKKAQTAPKGKAKFANPKDSTQTWTGRGRKPKWVIDHLAAKGKLEDLSI